MTVTLIWGIMLLLLTITLVCVMLATRKRTNVVNMANAANAPNQGIHADGQVTYLCGESDDWTTFAAAYTAVPASPKYAVVKIGADASHVRISASATDTPIGVCTDFGENDEDPINVKLFGAVRGTVLMVASAVIAAGALVQSNGDGAVKTAVSTGYVIGRAVTAAGAAGDVIEVIPLYTGVALA